jgi:hypothetical protein
MMIKTSLFMLAHLSMSFTQASSYTDSTLEIDSMTSLTIRRYSGGEETKMFVSTEGLDVADLSTTTGEYTVKIHLNYGGSDDDAHEHYIYCTWDYTGVAADDEEPFCEQYYTDSDQFMAWQLQINPESYHISYISGLGYYSVVLLLNNDLGFPDGFVIPEEGGMDISVDAYSESNGNVVNTYSKTSTMNAIF